MKIRIDICICTYKRPILLSKCIESLLNQQSIDSYDCTIIVTDNDANQSAMTVVANFSDQNRPNPRFLYLCEPDKNIAKARNKCLEHSSGDFIAFIDDDEDASHNWLFTHLNSIELYQSAVSAGPVLSRFSEHTPAWISNGYFFDRTRYATGTILSTTRTGNVLLKKCLIPTEEFYFKEEYGLTGGSDSEFFRRLSNKNVKIIWTDEAIVTEEVPESRACSAWLLKRSYRIGQGMTRISVEQNSINHLPIFILRNFLLASYAITQYVVFLPIDRKSSFNALRKFSKRLGMLTALSKNYYQEYK
ncbi:glycosyltransferase [Zhongshania aquimaris]|uniref:Glycosyltransferase n=1 Tax=Zhongshania aquimaris TaxID=2857107 RepID=A0ABS6VPE4_9GAMM|nr:glycosyltransferase [Zhongshania aquimaris]MBW2940189.1 glycosyltransferase [Zhongshania aquimaris]